MQIYSPVGTRYNASLYYRVEQPLMALDYNHFTNILLDNLSSNISREQRNEYVLTSDLMYLWNTIGPAITQLQEYIDEVSRRKETNGGIPPAIITTCDDALFHVETDNPAFSNHGIRNADGSFILPGDTVKMYSPIAKHTVIGYVDNEKGFDVASNHRRLQKFKNVLKRSHGIVVTTEFLKKYYEDEVGHTNIAVLPNTVNHRRFPKIQLVDNTSEVRVVLQQSDSHGFVVQEIGEALARVLKKYPNATLVFLGGNPGLLSSHIDLTTIELHPWDHFYAWYTKLSSVNGDINLCPLLDSTFDRARSGLKFYEGSALPKPMATLARNLEPYEDIKEGETGLLYNTPEEFETKLSGLIEDATLRKTLAANAKDWVLENRDTYKWGEKWWEFFSKTVEEVRERNT